MASQMDPIDEMLVQHANSQSKLTVRTFTTDEEGIPEQHVLIEGDATALSFLAEIILAHVNSSRGCAWGIHPNGAGSLHFSGASTTGVFLHKLPCDLHPENTIR